MTFQRVLMHLIWDKDINLNTWIVAMAMAKEMMAKTRLQCSESNT
jgi:hypothetical protein